MNFEYVKWHILEQVFELLDKELEVSLAIAKLYEKNYYCWSYREWVTIEFFSES